LNLTDKAVVKPAAVDNIGITRGGIVKPAKAAHTVLLVIEMTIKVINKPLTKFRLRFSFLIFVVCLSSCLCKYTLAFSVKDIVSIY